MDVKQVSIKKILYTTDLSDTALHAFSYAVSLANLYNASITVLHVMADYSDVQSKLAGFIGQDHWEEIQDRNLKETRQALIGKRRDNVMIKDALTQFTQNVKVDGDSQTFVTDEVLVVKGNPVDQIIKVSEEHNCDLIVMGTHGYNILEDMIGTTARKVLRRSKIPVLAVRLRN